MNEDSKQAAVAVPGYISKLLSGKTNYTDCTLKLIANERFIEHAEYLNLLSRGGHTTPCHSLSYFTFQRLCMIDFISSIVMRKIKNISVRNVSEKVSLSLNGMNVDFVCENIMIGTKSLHCALW